MSRDLRFNLSTNPAVADLGSPTGRWEGNTTGMFNILRNPGDGLFRKYFEQNNPNINVGRSRVERNPVINTTIERKFVQQNSADIKVEINSPMEKEYQQARDAARNRINRKDLYDKAVFPTDTDLQRFEYPIKSGYYFNPAGRYSFKVETVTYKPVTADTQEHKGIVDNLINSFNYETDLMYIDNYGDAVNIKGELLPQWGNSFTTRPGILTAQDNIGINGIELVTILDRSSDESRYTKRVEEIHYDQESGGDTHQYWKMVMEGYEESKTLSSRDNYKYREYVKEGQRMYKITETTEVEIIINKDNINTFTHAHMPDGEYYIQVWMDNIDLRSSNHQYKLLGTLSGVALDEMNITVKGSLYDD